MLAQEYLQAQRNFQRAFAECASLQFSYTERCHTITTVDSENAADLEQTVAELLGRGLALSCDFLSCEPGSFRYMASTARMTPRSQPLHKFLLTA